MATKKLPAKELSSATCYCTRCGNTMDVKLPSPKKIIQIPKFFLFLFLGINVGIGVFVIWKMIPPKPPLQTTNELYEKAKEDKSTYEKSNFFSLNAPSLSDVNKAIKEYNLSRTKLQETERQAFPEMEYVK